MPQISATVRSLPSLGKATFSAITRGDRVPYLGMASQHTRIRRGPALAVVGITAFVLSVLLRIVVASTHPGSQWNMVDLSVYQGAGKDVAHHQSGLYSRRYGFLPLPYIYPPFPAFVFHELGSLTFNQLELLSAIVSIACLAAVSWASWGLLGYRATSGRLGAAAATAAVCLWLEPVTSTLTFGQINLLIMALVMLDLAQSDRKWTKGVGVGLATAIKLTPGLFIVYLLLTRRIRAAIVATGTFVAVSAGTWVLLPAASHEFWFHTIGVTPVGRDYLSNQSFEGMFLRLAGGSDSGAKLPWLICSLLMVVVGMACAALAANRGAELLGLCVTSIVALAVSPISWTNHWVWFVPLFVLALHSAIHSRHRWAPAWTVLGVIMVLAWPNRVSLAGVNDPNLPFAPRGLIWYLPQTGKQEESWDPFQTIIGNGYLIAGVIFVAVAAYLEFQRLRAKQALGTTESEPSLVSESEPSPVSEPSVTSESTERETSVTTV